MAHCPACGRNVPLGVVLQFSPWDTYHCRWCAAESVVDGARFTRAARACAVLTGVIPVVAYVLFPGLACPLGALFAWVVACPFVFSSWLFLRMPHRLTPPGGGAALPGG